METVRELIIIPDSKQVNIPIFKRKLHEEEGHAIGIKEFSDQHNLGITHEELEIEKDNYHDMKWYIEMTKLGHLVIQKDENINIYLPPIITEEQYRYLAERKNEFYKYKGSIHAYSIYKENDMFYENELMIKNEKTKLEILYQEIDKKYIPNTDSFILVIPNEEELLIENGIYFQEFDTNIGHAKMLQVFCMRYLLPIKSISIVGNDWGLKMSKQGILVATREKERIYFFIPENLSDNQKKWLINNKESLYSYEELEAVIWLDEYNYRIIYKDEDHPYRKEIPELIDEIYKEINKKQKKLERG